MQLLPLGIRMSTLSSSAIMCPVDINNIQNNFREDALKVASLSIMNQLFSRIYSHIFILLLFHSILLIKVYFSNFFVSEFEYY